MTMQALPQDLADFLVTRNFDPEYFDEQGQPAEAGDAKTMKFDYVAGTGKNYGTAVCVVADDELNLFYGDNLGRGMEPEDKDEWFSFLEELSNKAASHSATWSPRDINQLKHTLAGIAAIKEGLFEGYYGNRKVSYMGEQTQARLVINHNRTLGEDDKRYRYVESLFIETADQERFRLPFKSLAAGRAMLEHVRQGGRPYDIRGNHITEIVSEMAVLSRFNRAQHNRVFEGVTQELVESARQYYHNLQETVKHLGSSRGYQAYFESWAPDQVGEAESLVENLRNLFVTQTLDARIEAALPTLAKIQQQGNNMKEAQIFENWINNLSEGTWALPETPEQMEKINQLMSAELIVGPDATNATELLYDIVGDDELFDILNDLADRSEGRANIWDDSDVQRRLAELGVQTPQSTAAEPADVAQDTAPEMKKQGMTENANAVDINQLASQMKFLPTTKLAKQYKFVKDGVPGKMPAMTYTVSSQEQPVVTITSDGKETQNVAAPNDVIMSGPSRENYVVKAAKFPKLYQGTMGGPVIPEQGPRMVALYTGQQSVTFTAPWGESMVLKPGDYLVKDGDAGYYRIAKAEYEQTYNQPGSNGKSGSTGKPGMVEASDQENINFDNWLKTASPRDLWDMASKYESSTPYIGREVEKYMARQKELLGPAGYREKQINDRLKAKLKPHATGDGKNVQWKPGYPKITVPMREGDNTSTFVEDRELAEMLKYAGVPLREGVLNDDTRNIWDHLLDRFPHEVEQFRQSKNLDDELYDDLYDALFDYYDRHGAMPYRVQKAKDGSTRQWISNRLSADLGLDENLISPMIMPVSEGSCNMTMEGSYCPEHGLMECGSMEEDGGAVGMPYSMGEEQVDEFIDPDTVTHAINALNPVTGAVAGATLGKGIEKAADWYKNRQEKKALAKQQQQNGVAEGNDDPINSNSAMTGSYYEGKETDIQEGDALLARIKSLALLR